MNIPVSTFDPRGVRNPRSIDVTVSRHRLKDGPDWADVPAPNLASKRWVRPTIPAGFGPGGDFVAANGGTVVVGGLKFGAFVPTYKRVSIAPVFDPDATSMVPMPGWKVGDAPYRIVRRGADDAAVDMLAGDGWILPRADAVKFGLVRAA